MSVFRVKLNNTEQGLLDRQPLGTQFATSIQRQVYVMGPNRINRLLRDGETFTDCNYWKRFAYPQSPLNEAFIEVVTDDGSVYSDYDASENVYPKVYSLTCDGGSSWTDNVADILGDTGGFAVFCQVTNQDSGSVQVRLNGKATAVFTLAGNTSQVFNAGDLTISKVEVDNSASGASEVVVEILCSVKSVATS